ncbi:MAG: PKD domain-containing protein [Ignavibacteriales bacterium]|nr:PKD domain-containing protein [Ignavibacteriales bacterium]
MKRFSKIFLLWSCFIFYYEVRADHFFGGQITYEYLGGDNYKLSVRAYRDCKGVEYYGYGYLQVEPPLNGLQTIVLEHISVSDITNVCSSESTSCQSVVHPYGVEEWLMSKTVSIPTPGPIGGYRFSFENCCRSLFITTGGAGGPWYISTTIDVNRAPRNTSPQFLNYPSLFVCANNLFVYNSGAYDVDGDSLAYSLVPCMQTATQAVNYFSPWSATNPITSNPPLSINSQSGDVSFTPTNAGEIAIMALRVEEFRNGMKIGEVVRDLQITVVLCNNLIPRFISPNFSAVTVYAGNQYCVDFVGVDSDNDTTKNRLTMSISTAIDSNTWSWSNPSPSYGIIQGTFCLNTRCSQIRSQPYIVNILIKDNACPIYGSNVKTLLIYVKDSIDFSYTAPLCKDEVATFTSSSRCAQTIIWDFDDGTPFETGTEVQHVFRNTGNYAVQMIAISGSGIADTIERTVTVSGTPRARFSTNPSSIEPNQLIQFNYTGSVTSGQTYRWYFGDGDSSTQRDPTHTFQNLFDSVTVTLIVTSENGCVDTSRKSFYFITKALFETTPPFCEGMPVVFTNLSQHADTFQWNFGDGSLISHEINPVHIYNGSGTFLVQLIAANNTRSDTAYQSITIGTVPSASFVTVPTEFRQQTSISFFNTSISDSDASLYWNFGDNFHSGIENPTHIYNSNKDSVEVLFVITNSSGCADSVTKTFVFAPFADFNSDTIVCEYDGIAFTNLSLNATSYVWDFHDGTPISTLENPVHIFSIAGTYSVSLIALGVGTPDTLVRTITVIAQPTAAFSFDSNAACSSLPIQFNNHSLNATSYFWNFGDGSVSTFRNPLYSYNLLGNYTVVLIVTNSVCSDTAQMNITVTTPPVPLFNVDRQKVCTGEIVSFNNLSTNASTYRWDFGDGDTSNLRNPEHAFDSSGFYTVTLLANNGSCVRSFNMGIMVYEIPVADFIATPSDFLPDVPITFTNLSTTGGDITYFWNFGDRSTSTEFSPTHVYRNNFSSVTVTLITFVHGGLCSDTMRKTFGFQLDANFTYNTPICQKEKAVFINTSVNAKKFFWNFGDGSTSKSKNPKHKYSAAGTYTVTLVASNNFFADTMSNVIQVIANPTANFSFSDSRPCGGTTVKFFNTSSNATQFFWDFKDGSPVSTDSSPTHIFSRAGTYKVKLVVRNGICADSIVKSIKVNISPQALFQLSDSVLCINTPLRVTNLSVNAKKYRWSFGDGTDTITDNSPDEHYYASPGNFQVSLVVIRGSCSDTLTDSVLVLPSPQSLFFTNADSVCFGTPFVFQNLSQFANLYRWEFGDSSFSFDTNAVHTYTRTGTFIVSLICSNGSCEDTARDTVTVLPSPVASFSIAEDSLCVQSLAAFQNTSQNAFRYYWNFGDGTPLSSIVNATHQYDTLGTFTVMLVATNGFCSDTLSKLITILPSPTAQFSVTNLPACNGMPITFSNASMNASTYIWNFGDGSPLSFDMHPVHTFINGGDFQVKLVSLNGTCSDSIVQPVSVTQKPQAGFSVQNSSACENDNFAFTNSSQFATNYFWDFGDSTTSLQRNPQHSYSNAATYIVTLVAANPVCSDTVTQTVTVLHRPVAIFSVSDSLLCLSSSVTFQNASHNADSLLWNFGDGNISRVENPVHRYVSAGTYRVMLIAKNARCADTVVHSVTIIENVSAQFQPNPLLPCVSLPVIFVNQSQFALSYEWTFGDSSSLSTEEHPTHIYSDAGLYLVTLVVSNGICSDTTSQLIEVFPLPKADFITEPTTIIPSVPIKFISTGTRSIGQKYFWEFGDGGISHDSLPIHTYSQSTLNATITLIVTNRFGCSDTIAKTRTVGSLFNIPNAFTPNGDGVNDEFYVIGFGITEAEFKIFNQWGELVFESNQVGQGNGWNGKYKGKLQDIGVYVYYFQGTGIDGQRYFKKGNITLLR